MISIEQRAHEAAMAHLSSLGVIGSQEAADAYQHVYDSMLEADMSASIARCGGYHKAVESAIDMARLHEQGMAAMEMMGLRMETARLKDELKAALNRDPVIHITNMTVCAMGGFALAMILVWLK